MSSTSAEMLRIALSRREAGQIVLENIPVWWPKLSAAHFLFEHESVWVPVLKEGADERAFASLPEFLTEGVEHRTVPARVYRCPDRLVAVIVPEDYAAQLDAVRELRRALETPPEEPINRIRLLEQMQSLPLGQRALPEDILALIEALPVKSVIHRVILSGEPNPCDIWYRRQFADTFVSVADGDKYGGEIRLYQCSVDRYLAENLFREWAHFVGSFNRQLECLFRLARKLEPDGHFSREYAKQPGEALAVDLGEQVMGLSSAEAWAFGMSAPIRATVLARGLRQAIASGRDMHEPSSLTVPFTRRVDVLDAEIAPIARAKLVELANGSTGAGAAHDAALLLAFIGKPDDLARLAQTERLDLSGIPVNLEDVDRLEVIPNLRHLQLGHTGVVLDGAWRFTRQPLETLGLAGLHLMNYHLHAVARIRTLQSLDISGTLVNDDAIPTLSRMALRYLDVRRSRITEAGKQALQRGLPQAKIE